MKRSLIVFTLLAALILTLGTLEVLANFGNSVEVIAKSDAIIKTGIIGKKLTFSDTDFKQGLAIGDFDSITISAIPSSTEGALMLAGRRVGEGTTVRRKNIASLAFIPSSAEVKESGFKFTISPFKGSEEYEFKLRFTDKVNYEPKIDSTAPTSLTTQRDIAIWGKLSASDPEGDSLSYMIIEYPKHGSLKLDEGGKGEFCYTPADQFIGDDKFSYVVRDEWGNFSSLSYMTLSVDERMSEVVYVDMEGTKDYAAAVALSAMGIMDGRIIGDGSYFMPEGKVTRAEFVSMLMKSLGIKCDSSLSASYFDDNSDIPTALVPYVATAQRAGFIIGEFEKGELNFHPNEAMSSYEAAGIMRRMLGNKIKTDAPTAALDSTLPAWAREDVYIMCSLGIFDEEPGEITKECEVTRADCASYLYKLINM